MAPKAGLGAGDTVSIVTDEKQLVIRLLEDLAGQASALKAKPSYKKPA